MEVKNVKSTGNTVLSSMEEQRKKYGIYIWDVKGNSISVQHAIELTKVKCT